jgi:predicted PurR-regulated permease PerM
VLTALFALVPFVGAAVVWVPCAAWLYFYEGRTGAAIFLAAWGLLVVSMADNLIKPWVLKGQSNLHPLLAFLSVLGGASALGPIGILIGPLVVAFLQALLNILQHELAVMARREA